MKKVILLILLPIFFLSLFVFCYLKIMYPFKYYDIVYKYSNSYDVDPSLVAAIINVESGYRVDAKSSKGAVGLMQLLDTTAKDMADTLDMREYDLLDADDNINLGVRYIKYLSSIFDDSTCVIAAYNAGLSNVSKWLKDAQYSSNGVTLNHIPFKETREYVKQVKVAYKVYKSRFYIGI